MLIIMIVILAMTSVITIGMISLTTLAMVRILKDIIITVMAAK